ncbi:MAG: prepilin-type N-terminal cleavage/methylation domain-containing protein [Phycisphaerales bacterium]|nr:prepilin-type N-terminal cleavage/methylation domain-containing protein [Phycisphaerales bacterium]
MRNRTRRVGGVVRGFTLIELLVVIAIIALLVSILLPALAGARREAQAIKASVAARNISQGVQTYATDGKYYPPSYVYAKARDTEEWVMSEQTGSPAPHGYVHWSWSLFSSGNIPLDAFQSPALARGGAPRTYPGPKGEDADPGQDTIDTNITDRQVPRIAFAGNDAIFSRNKFANPGQRQNRLVNPAAVDGSLYGASKVILVAELGTVKGSWESVFGMEEPGATGQQSRSHRPVTPFLGVSSGASYLNEPNLGSAARFRYPTLEEFRTTDELGPNMIGDTRTSLNAVGRHHGGSKGQFGGQSNFAFCDGHVERMNVVDTVRKKLWGDKFWSVTGTGTGVNFEQSNLTRQTNPL